MKKKSVSLILCLCMLMSVLSVTAYAVTPMCDTTYTTPIGSLYLDARDNEPNVMVDYLEVIDGDTVYIPVGGTDMLINIGTGQAAAYSYKVSSTYNIGLSGSGSGIYPNNEFVYWVDMPEGEEGDVYICFYHEDCTVDSTAEPYMELTVHVICKNPDYTTTVKNAQELDEALSNDKFTEIHIGADFSYDSPINTDKSIIIDNGYNFTWLASQGGFRAEPLEIGWGSVFEIISDDKDALTVIDGSSIVDNGTIRTTGVGNVYWHAEFSSNSWPENFYDCTNPEYMMYCDFNMMGLNCIYNLTSDISESVTVSIPDSVKPGSGTSPMVSNLIEFFEDYISCEWVDAETGEVISDSFYFESIPYSMAGRKLKVTLTANDGYSIYTDGGFVQSITSPAVTVTEGEANEVYVDSVNGNDSNSGLSKDDAFRTLEKAVDTVADYGYVYLINDTTVENPITFEKSVSILKAGSDEIKLIFKDELIIGCSYVSFDDKLYVAGSEDGEPCTIKSLYDDEKGMVYLNNSVLVADAYDLYQLNMYESEYIGNLTTEALVTTSSSFRGSFVADILYSVIDGRDSFYISSDAPCVIKEEIEIQRGIDIFPIGSALKNGGVLVELPDSCDESITELFSLKSDDSDYELKFEERNGKKCLSIFKDKVISAECEPVTYGDSFTIEVVTDIDVNKIQFVGSSGSTITLNKGKAVGGKKLWSFERSYAAGEYPFGIRFKVGESWFDSEKTVSVKVGESSAEKNIGVQSVDYQPSADVVNVFTVKVAGNASKIRFIDESGATKTYDKKNADVLSIKYCDADGNTVDPNSEEFSCQVWEIRSKLHEGNYRAEAKFGIEWHVDSPYEFNVETAR